MNSEFKSSPNSLLSLGRKGQNVYNLKTTDDFIFDEESKRNANLSRVINPYDKSNSILGGRSRRHKRKTTRRHIRKMRSTRRRKSHSSHRRRK